MTLRRNSELHCKLSVINLEIQMIQQSSYTQFYTNNIGICILGPESQQSNFITPTTNNQERDFFKISKNRMYKSLINIKYVLSFKKFCYKPFIQKLPPFCIPIKTQKIYIKEMGMTWDLLLKPFLSIISQMWNRGRFAVMTNPRLI